MRTRADALAYRIHAQQLDRPSAPRELTDAATFDIGVQDTGRDGASWALANRGVPVRSSEELEGSDAVALAWTLRGSPHYYRRPELFDAFVATSPMSEADAMKRVLSADKVLKVAGVPAAAGLAEIAAKMRTVVTRPMVKGEVSTRLTTALDEAYLKYCVPCGAMHAPEQAFRLAALYAGLELEPGTSPPVLRRIKSWPRRTPGPAADPLSAPAHLQPIRNYLRFLGPARPADVAGFLETSVAEVKAHWPEDAVPVRVAGAERWWLGGTEPDLDAGLVRLLGGFDLLLQGRDRDLLVPDKSRHKALWPVIGRPGAVLVGAEVVGLWRPKAAGRRFTLRLELWRKVRARAREALEQQAELLAGHRGLTLSAIDEG
ncbi:MAG TPA: crosslink repair DNA glycosylase YcaQ family protein [Propionibacteriaceae bacterium]|jgi:hypothetical protein|nr:crosslink repair DNA glycosylase YcaQ family protein [Propionibacteriaceae bacterium]